MLRPGDVVVTEGGRHDWVGRFLRWALRSPWTHVFIVVNADILVESLYPHGVRVASLPERKRQLEREGRRYVVLHDPLLPPHAREAIARAALAQLGCHYNWLQAIGWFFSGHFWFAAPRRLTCSHLVATCYEAVGYTLYAPPPVGLLSDTHRADLARGYGTPDDVFHWSALRRKRLWGPRSRRHTA